MYENIYKIEQILGSDANLVLVGGSVRDLLLNRNNCDWDLATALLPNEVMQKANMAGIKVIPTGIKHGTVTLIINNQSFEVTTFRGDGTYIDGRRPEFVNFGVTLEQDLSRRDFTINAMAIPVNALNDYNWRMKLIDPFNGRFDVQNRIIRTVGNPLTRFNEDGLRILRAFRFASMLNFNIDPLVLNAVSQCLPIIQRISIERIFIELTKLLCSDHPEIGLSILYSTKLLEILLPELHPMVNTLIKNKYNKSIWEHTIEVVKHVPNEAKFRWSALLHDCGQCFLNVKNINFNYEIISLELAKRIMCRMHASNNMKSSVLSLIRYHNVKPKIDWSDKQYRYFLRQLLESNLSLAEWNAINFADNTEGRATGIYLYEHNVLLNKLNTLASANPPLTVKDLAINSKTLMDLAQRNGGLWLKKLQESLLDLVLQDPNNNKVSILSEMAKDWLHGQ